MPVRYSQAASGTPNPVAVLDIRGLSFNASCDDSGGTVTLNFSASSAAAATLHETVTVDNGPDISIPGNAFTGNLQIDLPAGATLQTGGPSAAAGYTRVAVEAVYSAPGTTIDLHMFAHRERRRREMLHRRSRRPGLTRCHAGRSRPYVLGASRTRERDGYPGLPPPFHGQILGGRCRRRTWSW